MDHGSLKDIYLLVGHAWIENRINGQNPPNGPLPGIGFDCVLLFMVVAF